MSFVRINTPYTSVNLRVTLCYKELTRSYTENHRGTRRRYSISYSLFPIPPIKKKEDHQPDQREEYRFQNKEEV